MWSSRPTSAPAWRTTSRSRPPNASSTCCSRRPSTVPPARQCRATRRSPMPPLDKPPLDKPPLDRPAEDRQRAYGDAARTLAAIEARRILDHLLQLQAIPSPTGSTDSIVRHVCGWLHEDRKSTT